MRRNWQRGMTLVELLVALAVTSIILVGLNGVFLVATEHYQQWSNRIHSASIPVALASDLQSDSHRYVVCSDLFVSSDTLDLCAAENLAAGPLVRYRVTGAAPFMIVREAPVGAAPIFLARGQTNARPSFWADCYNSGGDVVSGHIHVYDLRAGDGSDGSDATHYDRNNFMVYYTAPWRPGCPDL